MVFVTLCFFIATLLIGGSKALQGEVLPGLAFIAAGLFAYWAGSALKLAVFAPAATPRRVGFLMAAGLTVIGFGITLATGVRFDAYGHDMPGVAWVLAGLIAGIMGTKKRRYILPPPQAPQN
jgi:hypothetical protein